MRFATLGKTQEGSGTVIVEHEEKPTASSDLVPPSSPAATPVETQTPSPSVDRESLEREIRNEVEREFQLKLARMEANFKLLWEQKTREESSGLSEKEAALRREQAKLTQLMENLQQQRNQWLQGAQADIEQEVARHVEEERGKLRQTLQAELQQTRSLVEQLRAEMHERELEFQRKEVAWQEQLAAQKSEAHVQTQGLEQEVSRRLDAERVKMREEVRLEVVSLQTLVEQLKREIRERGEELQKREAQWRERLLAPMAPRMEGMKAAPEAESAPKVSAPEPAPPITPSTPTSPPPPHLPVTPLVPKAAETPKTTISEVMDPERQTKAKVLYDQLVERGNFIVEQIAKSQPFELTPLSQTLREVVDFASQGDTELISLALAPYPASSYFVHHSANCAIFSLILGLDFQFSPDELHDLAVGAFLHDIGLINIREDLNYPKQLTEQIQKEVLNHPLRGAETLQGKISETTLLAIQQHHEVCNGKGYPQGLSAAEIHPFAKIIHLADVFEALTHQRPYRKKPFDVSEAMKEIIEKGRGVYDQQAMKALMGRVGLYPVMSFVELSNRQIARVVRLNRKFPLSPLVRVEFDEGGRKLGKPTTLDLSQTQMFHIVGPVKEVPSYHAAKIAEAQKALKEPAHKPFLEFLPLIFAVLAVILVLYLIIKI